MRGSLLNAVFLVPQKLGDSTNERWSPRIWAAGKVGASRAVTSPTPIPRNRETPVMPFRTENPEPGNLTTLVEVAKHHEAAVAEPRGQGKRRGREKLLQTAVEHRFYERGLPQLARGSSASTPTSRAIWSG